MRSNLREGTNEHRLMPIAARTPVDGVPQLKGLIFISRASQAAEASIRVMPRSSASSQQAMHALQGKSHAVPSNAAAAILFRNLILQWVIHW